MCEQGSTVLSSLPTVILGGGFSKGGAVCGRVLVGAGRVSICWGSCVGCRIS